MSDNETWPTCGTSCSVYVDYLTSGTHFTPSFSRLGDSSVHHPPPKYPDPGLLMSSTSGASMTERPKKKDSSFYMNKKEYREMMERRNKEIRQAFAALKGASKIDMVFLIDCTGSMLPWIIGVKNTISTWSEAYAAKYPGGDFRCAFVGYSDYDQEEDSRTKLLDFTTDPLVFQRFVHQIKILPGTGGDTAEDVMGGLKAAIEKLTWRKSETGTKVIVHIADAPCHGRKYHDGVGDLYPSGDPAKTSHHDLMEEIAKRGIQYYFGHINERATAKMVGVLNKSLMQLSDRKQIIQEFDASNTGSLEDAIYNLLISSVLTAAGTSVGEATPIRDFKFETKQPDRSKLEQKAGKRTPISSSLPSLTEIQNGAVEVELPTDPISIKRALHPFAVGGLRLAYYAYTGVERVVLKIFKRTGKIWESQKRYLEVFQMYKIVAAFAKAFNQDKPQDAPTLDVLRVDIIRLPGDTLSDWYTMEPYIEGKYEKFNDNKGTVRVSTDPVCAAMQAFSHYTWVKSEKKLVICDLQGVRTERGVLITDPAIHAREFWKYGRTNFGPKGIRYFFKTHRCTKFCKKMGLEQSIFQTDEPQ